MSLTWGWARVRRRGVFDLGVGSGGEKRLGKTNWFFFFGCT